MNRIVKNPTDARQASKEGVGRYVLAISTVVAVLVLLAIYLVMR